MLPGRLNVIRIDQGIGLLALSLILSACFRIPYFQHTFIFIDEAWWANGSRVLVKGGTLYQDVLLDKNPPIFLYCASLFNWLGINMNSIHLGALLLVFGISLLLFCLGSTFFSPTTGGLAAVIYSVASTTFYTPRIIGMNTETLMVLFSTAAMYFFLEGVVHGRVFCFFLAGLLSSFATITKPVAVTEIALFSIFLLVNGRHRIWSRLRWVVLLADGYLCGILLLVAYLIGAGNLASWWDQAILYGFRYVGFIDLSTFVGNLIRSTASFGIIYFWLWILIWMSGTKETVKNTAYRIAVCWLLASLVGVILGRRFYANYFIQVLPAMSLVGAVGAINLWKQIQARRMRILAQVCALALCMSFLWFHSRTIAHWYFALVPGTHERVQLWGMCREDRKIKEIAEYLRSRTEPEDRIFVWGSKAQLYFLADRPMATPCMDYDVGDDMPPNAADERVRSQTVQALRRTLPRYIIDVQRNARLEKFPHFRQLVLEHYFLEKQLHEAKLYRLRDVQAADADEREVPPKS